MKLFNKSLLGVFLFFICTSSFAQLTANIGGTYNYSRNEVLKNDKPFFAYSIGVGFQFYFLKNYESLSAVVETRVNKKGYTLEINDKKHQSGLIYLSLPLLANYSFNESISLQVGPEFSFLIPGVSKYSEKVFNQFDFAIVGGLTFFDNKFISLYVRYNHGLNPVLDYYSIDKIGNIESFEDFYNTSVMLGIKIKITNEKVKFFK